MKRTAAAYAFLIIAAMIVSLLGAIHQAASARTLNQEDELVVRGAQLYDDWAAVLDQSPPSGNHPIWGRQEENTRSGPDTWRCVTCHGWDYQGVEGANRSGPNFTGFPGVFDTQSASAAEIAAALTGEDDPEHNFVPPLVEEDVEALAAFLQQGLIDDNQYIDLVSRQVIEGDRENGQRLYTEACASCHGEDGTALAFRYEGQNVSLGTLAVQEPWRFLHRIRYGTARASEMPAMVLDGWTPEEGRDVLLYAQSLPTGFPGEGEAPGQDGGREPFDERGGPSRGLFTGILTAIWAMVTSLGFAVLLGAVLIGIIFFVVWLIRGQQ